MLFAVFEASVVSQEHDADDARLIRVIEKRCKVYTTADLRSAAVDPTRLFRLARPEKRCCPQRVGKIGLALSHCHTCENLSQAWVFVGECHSPAVTGAKPCRDVRPG